jgi:hypothetical protein
MAVVRNQTQVVEVLKLCNTQSCFCKRRRWRCVMNTGRSVKLYPSTWQKVGRHNMPTPPPQPRTISTDPLPLLYGTISTTTASLTTTTNTTITTCSSSCWRLILARLSRNPLTLLRNTNALRFNSIIPTYAYSTKLRSCFMLADWSFVITHRHQTSKGCEITLFFPRPLLDSEYTRQISHQIQNFSSQGKKAIKTNCGDCSTIWCSRWKGRL